MGATAEQFEKWRQHAKTLTVESLRYVMNDAREAEQAMSTHNEERELYYRDMYLTYCDELRTRKQKSQIRFWLVDKNENVVFNTTDKQEAYEYQNRRRPDTCLRTVTI